MDAHETAPAPADVPSGPGAAQVAVAPEGRRSAQRRTVSTLVVSQVLGGVGTSGGIAVGSLLAESILGSSGLAGLANTFQILGSALLVIPMVRLMARRGRRAGLTAGYAVAVLGASLAVLSAVVRSFELLLLATFLFGAATATGNQARYAAADLAEPAHRGRDLSTVVWATTVGAVLGPNLLTPSAPLARAVGIEPVAGVWFVSVLVFALAGIWLTVRLRPDPLLLSRATEQAASRLPSDDGVHPGVAASTRPADPPTAAWRILRQNRAAALGVATVALGHTVMVSVMVMTPLHIRHGGATLDLVGIVISVHVLGMYAFSPLMGRLVDARGSRVVALIGSAILLVGCALAGISPMGWSWALTSGLFLLGLGWSATLVSGSTLLTASVPVADRPRVQGFADLVMGLCGALGGGVSGVIVEQAGYSRLSVLGGAVALTLAVILLLPDDARGSSRSAASHDTTDGTS
ncbi:MAG: MFS transporter [Micrococcales bacterium]|nr:MFS transporter [Micrococcales bacterium]